MSRSERKGKMGSGIMTTAPMKCPASKSWLLSMAGCWREEERGVRCGQYDGGAGKTA